MLFSIALLIVIVFLAFKVAPVEKAESANIHSAGQIGLLAAIALFGVDYYTSFYYATGEMTSALHPYGLQKWGYVAVAVIATANIVFSALYMYSLGIFNEGGGLYTAAMRSEPEPIIAGDYDDAVHSDHPEAPSLLAQYLQTKPKQKPKAGGTPKETAPGDEEGKEEYTPREASAGSSSPVSYI